MTKREHLNAAIGEHYADRLIELATDVAAADEALGAIDADHRDAEHLHRQRARAEATAGMVLRHALKALER